MAFELAVDIAAPAPAVFDFVADFTTMPQWYSAVERVDRVEGAKGLGTRYAVHRHLPGGPARNDVAVTSYEQDREITFASQTGPTPFVYRYTVEPVDGGTRLVLDGTISGSGLPGGALLGPLAERLFKRGMRDNLNVLKAILERSAS
jgi:uncharacterized protein YndB with AHSA1/START domain